MVPVRCIRWSENHFHLDAWNLGEVDMADPRKFRIKKYRFPVYALTSLSWLLPVELSIDGSKVIQIHYDKIISPQLSSQEFGIEDARISSIEGNYYMTTCCVSSEGLTTMLFISNDGLNYQRRGIVLDHQNKDMLLFEGRMQNRYWALTRPLGECYFATVSSSSFHPGAAIHLAHSDDVMHWKPADTPFLRARISSKANEKIGGGTPPILTQKGWLLFFHGVESRGEVGIYRTFWALLDRDDPSRIIRLEDQEALLESNPSLLSGIADQVYLKDVVFSTGIASDGNDFILASGECDLACRITRISKDYFLN